MSFTNVFASLSVSIDGISYTDIGKCKLGLVSCGGQRAVILLRRRRRRRRRRCCRLLPAAVVAVVVCCWMIRHYS